MFPIFAQFAIRLREGFSIPRYGSRRIIFLRYISTAPLAFFKSCEYGLFSCIQNSPPLCRDGSGGPVEIGRRAKGKKKLLPVKFAADCLDSYSVYMAAPEITHTRDTFFRGTVKVHLGKRRNDTPGLSQQPTVSMFDF